ncbi:carboxypeptidase-like regulatory domain-containing protein [Pedobacter frigidisoli]|uniref:Carboxypeptidase-like regulatory domain-containing protein n=1 Tax=Pedobacter frigidisoli TaxID=2530455 RepID=A0A4R0P2V1_9SPHI|nr:carboxypeptidase-like regulatory domain-containing protein [Pedobacter frigidisoli]TCD11145.1 carboxypeptidase-like regulatory domain-containing protein [Pedobacter frigidisoli]
MKSLAFQLLFILMLFASTNLISQEAYTISGIVEDEQHKPIQNATVFISGSQKVTKTSETGQFTFIGITAGNYSISSKMLGFETPSLAITIHDKSINLAIILKEKPITLNEVNIISDDDRKWYYSIFKEQFLGKSIDKKKCVILNSEILNFIGKKINPPYDLILKVSADELLIIENKLLGYRIKYLLRAFEYNAKTRITSYDGDSSFEEIEGTPEQKKIWAKNRLAAYQGSLMHFLRSAYNNTVLQEGFIANQLIKSSNIFDERIYRNPNPAKFSSLVNRVDSSFVSYKFNGLNIVYRPKKASLEIVRGESKVIIDSYPDDRNLLPIDATGKSSQLLLHLKEAIIDARGSVYSGYQTFLIRGLWSEKRLGDQLPFEYQP